MANADLTASTDDAANSIADQLREPGKARRVTERLSRYLTTADIAARRSGESTLSARSD